MELKKIEGFTPGPWFDRKPADSNGYVYVDGQSTRQGRIATCYNTETSIADATLIAYAPELYKLAEQYRDERDRLRGLIETAFKLGIKVHDYGYDYVWNQFKTDNQL